MVAEVSYESVLKGYQAHRGSRMATVQDVLDGIPDAHSAKAEAPKEQRSEPFTAVDMVSRPLVVQRKMAMVNADRMQDTLFVPFQDITLKLPTDTSILCRNLCFNKIKKN